MSCQLSTTDIRNSILNIYTFLQQLLIWCVLCLSTVIIFIWMSCFFVFFCYVHFPWVTRTLSPPSFKMPVSLSLLFLWFQISHERPCENKLLFCSSYFFLLVIVLFLTFKLRCVCSWLFFKLVDSLHFQNIIYHRK